MIISLNDEKPKGPYHYTKKKPMTNKVGKRRNNYPNFYQLYFLFAPPRFPREPIRVSGVRAKAKVEPRGNYVNVHESKSKNEGPTTGAFVKVTMDIDGSNISP